MALIPSGPLTFAVPGVLAAIPVALLLILILAGRQHWLDGPLWRQRLVGLRLVIVLLTLFALAQPRWGKEVQASASRRVWLVDQSASLGANGQAALARQVVQAIQAQTRRRDPLTEAPLVLSFAGHTRMGLAAPDALDPQQTDLGAALDMARRLLGPGGGRIEVLSDGQDTVGGVPEASQHLALDGIPVDVYPVEDPQQPDVRVDRVVVPASVRDGELYPVEVQVSSTGPTTATLRLSRAGDPQGNEQAVGLPAGVSTFHFEVQASSQGPAAWQAEVASPIDTQPANNRAAAVTIVYPRPRVLLVADPSHDPGQLQQALDQAGIDTELGGPSTVPTRLSDLAHWDAIVLLDLPASSFALDQMLALQEFVRSLGHGLVVTGGTHSFTAGGYKGTPLEETLPVAMDPPDRGRRPPVALLIIMDRSGSMGSSMNGVTKMALAEEAAIRASDLLKPEDWIGVETFNMGQEWAVPFQQIGQGLSIQQIQDRIASIAADGGTDILSAVRQGLGQLVRQPAPIKYVILLTDGMSLYAETPADYQKLIGPLRGEYNLTLSTIAIGFDADQDLLKAVAEIGGGRYHFAQLPQDLPSLVIQETVIARSEALQLGTFRALLGDPHPVLNGLTPADMPPLTGYVGVKLKPQADLALRSAEKDPLLASWQYGLGRAVAWLSDTGDGSGATAWASTWPAWSGYSRFWGQVIRYAIPDPSIGPLTAHASVHGNQATLSVESVDEIGRPVDLADTFATVSAPGSSGQEIALLQVAPGRYEQTLTVDQPGAYVVRVLQHKDSLSRQAQTGFAIPYPAEYGPPIDGQALLARLAHDTGGQVLTDLSQAGAGVTGVPAPPARPLWPYLLALAALLWPVEIGIRRWKGMIGRSS